ncbi:MAG: CoA pyrophosphatase [Bacteroidales bacterium]|nr:CoA pyrophosphatase [Bacteroidales bacterium]
MENKLKSFINQFSKILSEPLPGLNAQSLMIPPTRRKQIEAFENVNDAKLSAVLVLFYETEEDIRFVLIRRAKYEGVHSGQIALPGGQFEDSDNNLTETALREAEEEIGIDAKKVKLLGALSPLYIPPSHFKVFPYVGCYPEKPDFKVDGTETTEIIEISLSDFYNPEFQTEKEVKTRNGTKVTVPCFYLKENIVWGATAMILGEMFYLLKQIKD